MPISPVQSSPQTTPVRRSQGLAATLRLQLAALFVLCIATLTAPQAVAQCGPNITLSANQWSMVGVPCVPGAGNTIADIFGPSLGAGNYGVTWIAWKRVYDSPTLCATTPADCYIKLTLANTVQTGDAFWIYTTVAANLNLSGVGASATPGPNFQFPAKLSPDGNSRYYMFANPYDGTVVGPSLQFPVLLFGFIPYVGTIQQAIDTQIISRSAHYWNGNTYFTEDLTTTAASFAPKRAAWFEFLQPNPVLIQAADLRVPDPGPP